MLNPTADPFGGRSRVYGRQKIVDKLSTLADDNVGIVGLEFMFALEPHTQLSGQFAKAIRGFGNCVASDFEWYQIGVGKIAIIARLFLFTLKLRDTNVASA